MAVESDDEPDAKRLKEGTVLIQLRDEDSLPEN